MLRIYGASDDLVELEGIVDDEIGGGDEEGTRIEVGNLAEGGCIVIMRYAPTYHKGGTWTAEIMQFDEDVPMPWPVAIHSNSQENRYPKGGCGYTVVVEIDCPPGTPVKLPKGEDDED